MISLDDSFKAALDACAIAPTPDRGSIKIDGVDYPGLISNFNEGTDSFWPDRLECPPDAPRATIQIGAQREFVIDFAWNSPGVWRFERV